MPRNRIDFLLDGKPHFAIYGWQAELGYWAEVRAPGRRKPIAEYGAVWPGYAADAPLIGLLRWLAQMRVLDATGLDEALLAWASPVPVRLSKRGRAALQVIEILKREAD